MQYNGFRFLSAGKRGNTTYYHCAHKIDLLCRASIKVNNLGEVTVIKPHNGHGQIIDHRALFRQDLVRRAIHEHTPCRVIYDEEAARHPEAARTYSYVSASSTMLTARRRHNPPIPQTLRGLGELLAAPGWAEKFYCSVDNVNEPFFRHIIEVDGHVSVIFASQRLLDVVVAGVEEFHVDGTFKCKPAAPPCHQLLTMHCIVHNKSIAVAYALMENRVRNMYNAVFNIFRQLAPTLEPAIIISDYETALRAALQEVFPNASVIGCFYHYSNAVWKMAARIGFIRIMRENNDARKAIKLMMVLPLLPAVNIVEGLDLIENWCQERQFNFERMFTYIRRYWINTVTPAGISVYGLPRRTNNDVEAFNKILLLKMKEHPNVYTFIENLIRINSTQFNHFEQLRRGLRISRPTSARYRLNNTIITRAQQALTAGDYTIFHYLEVVAHQVDDVERNLHELHVQRMLDELDDDNDAVLLLNDNVAPAAHIVQVVDMAPGADDLIDVAPLADDPVVVAPLVEDIVDVAPVAEDLVNDVQGAPMIEDVHNALVYRDGNLISGSLEALIQHMVPTDIYYPDRAYLFAFLLSSRLFIKPHELLAKVRQLCEAQQGFGTAGTQHGPGTARFAEHLVQLLAEWTETFPYDFRDERVMQQVRTITQQCMTLNQSLRGSIPVLLQNLQQRLKTLETYEKSLDQTPPLDDSQSTDITEVCPNPSTLAQQLTHMELERLSFIGPEEFVQAFAKENPHIETSFKDMKKTRNLEQYVQWFNRLSYFVATQVCKHPKKKQRVRVVEFWIETARECFNIGNFNSLMAIIAGLNMSPISRLKKTWNKIQSGKFSILEHQMDPSSNFSSYRSTLKAAMWRSAGATDQRQRIVIPFFSLLVKDLYFLNEGCSNKLPNGHINFEKFWQLAKQVTEFMAWKQVTCPFEKETKVISLLQRGAVLSENALALASFECEPPENNQERERCKSLKAENSA